MADVFSWASFLKAANIPLEDAATIAKTFKDQCMTKSSLLTITHEELKELGVDKLGWRKAIMDANRDGHRPLPLSALCSLLSASLPRPLPC
jgi:hypothetical protein